jgi:hypothetical protein
MLTSFNFICCNFWKLRNATSAFPTDIRVYFTDVKKVLSDMVGIIHFQIWKLFIYDLVTLGLVDFFNHKVRKCYTRK